MGALKYFRIQKKTICKSNHFHDISTIFRSYTYISPIIKYIQIVCYDYSHKAMDR